MLTVGEIWSASATITSISCVTGVFVPGIGGLLDLVDSLIFTVPFLYYYHHVRVMLVSG